MIITIFILLLSLTFLQCDVDDGLSPQETILLDSSPFNMEQALVSIASNGDILVGDPNQGKISVFEADGTFIRSFGQLGRGPGEFGYLIHVIQLANGDYMVSDLSGKIERFSSDGEHMITYPIPVLGRTAKLIEIDSETLLIAGLSSRDENLTLLHLLDLNTGEITSSFFEAPFQMSDYGGLLHSMSGFSDAVFDGSLIYAFITFSDIMYIFDLEGNLIDQKKIIDFIHFTPLEPFDYALNDDQLAEKMESYSLISNIYWKNESTIIIEHVKSVDVQIQPFRHSVEYGMSMINLDGGVACESNKLQRVHGFNSTSGLLYTGHPDMPETGEPLVRTFTIE